MAVRLPSKQDTRVRFPSPAYQEMKLRGRTAAEFHFSRRSLNYK